MHLAMDDVAFAYKKCAVLQQEFGILCYWNHAKQKVVFCEQWGLPFGAVASVTGFCRLPHLLTRFARIFFAALCDHYIDDALQPDFVEANDSAQVALGYLFKKVGIPFSEKKRQRPESVQNELGVTCDLSSFHTKGEAVVTPKVARCEHILETLADCEARNRLTSGQAKETFGKLSFSLQSLFGRVGRAAALPILLRCYNSGDTSFGQDLREMRAFFATILDPRNLPARIFRFNATDRPVIIYSDASESPGYRGLGAVIHDCENPTHGRHYTADICPKWLEELFLEHGATSICSLEMLAALCSLLTFRRWLKHRRVLFFIDNTAAWSAMINGYTSSPPMARLSTLFHLAAAALSIDCWVEWVNTDANLADLPSRPLAQRTELYNARPAFKQLQMIFPSPAEHADPRLLFHNLQPK